ncbi:[FeFe] hydrogenase H-cluster radical SAM maturase HydG [Desulfosporosinus sp. BICA1-9]|uniref:[FeFe] hydrogenase H-cluster radical SAM maturase HydG n=1 Tax=Desulfosporosinus sp. BICA1-9 TaxID=1531958 RepID=UPI00054B4F59|nr:[FeFe] hydrogenase H-cluster radical SAM maturase HydG [Desulfosporosinus sp. BICA1-9]KJS48505.1 MAG: thiamine biosynthesis protein ThiH [Peptococcaceae bacterium BRH_c23]KJS84140.1 MAG: thiamine biosynthesis protein ThiH [Desulfosporosinus sp. BICA1-9]KJS84196.1 MAG: thiamine biosynthesis protein ThiH [Desulfosporosinus sp. BICA1-9]
MTLSRREAFNREWQAADFIYDQEIKDLLQQGKQATTAQVRMIIAKARAAKGLTPLEVAVLLENEDAELTGLMYEVAAEIKQRIYGKRIVLFAPLYLSDHCINSCVYCGYKRDNKFIRQKLTMEQIKGEVKVLEGMGHKRLALEAGEHPEECPIEYVVDCLKTIYDIKFANGSIRRCNVNIAATTVEEYRLLKDAGIGTYILFQETYHWETYQKMHPAGPKADYDWHTTAHDRAMTAGIDDVGFGVLFGLYDYKFEVLGLMMHALHLEQRFGVGPHTISVPRLRPARGVDYETFPYLVSDEEFMRLVAIIRLAVPYTGMIASTRERPELRDRLLSIGISQISAGSCTGVGGYIKEAEKQDKTTTDHPAVTNQEKSPQFEVEDHRSPDEVLYSVCNSGWLPSYCTACYRQGRTGDRFMALAKSGEIQNVCQPNAILTFKEYLLDYASPETQKVGEETILKHLQEIKSEKIRNYTEEALKRLELGERDIYL